MSRQWGVASKTGHALAFEWLTWSTGSNLQVVCTCGWEYTTGVEELVRRAALVHHRDAL